MPSILVVAAERFEPRLAELAARANECRAAADREREMLRVCEDLGGPAPSGAFRASLRHRATMLDEQAESLLREAKGLHRQLELVPAQVVRDARVIATTVHQAITSPLVAGRKYPLVVLDEASFLGAVPVAGAEGRERSAGERRVRIGPRRLSSGGH